MSSGMIVLLAALVFSAPNEPVKPLEQGPVEFVCDSLQLFNKPRRVVCTKNVVARRGDLTLCCDHFEGIMNDKNEWERLICSHHVRAQRGDEIMWSDKAIFIMATSDLILTGRPRVRRGQSVLAGERIVIDTKNDRAHIEQPRGRVEPVTEGAAPIRPLPLTGELPRRCPVPSSPEK